MTLVILKKRLVSVSLYQKKDIHYGKRSDFKKYKVKTVTLDDLLTFHNAPKKIDYLSIDTEGSEYSILKNFDFDKFNIQVITVEHNNTENKKLLDNLLLANNYKKVMDDFSQFESWYVKV